MAGRYINDRNTIGVKKEAVSGEFETPNSVLPVKQGKGLWVPKWDTDKFTPASAHHGSNETVVITDFATQEVAIDMRFPADDTIIADLLVGCGVVSTDVTDGRSYAYSTGARDTLSLQQIAERVTTNASGARGDITLTCEVGKAVALKVDLKGTFREQIRLAGSDADNTLSEAPVTDSVYMTKNCTAYLVNGNQAHFTKVEFKLGADIGVPKDTCAGVSWTKDIKPTLAVHIKDSIDNEQSFNDLANGHEFNFVIPLFDINGTKKWELRVPKCVVVQHSTPAEDGLIAIQREYECRKVNGDDNFELIAYTA